MVTGWVYTLSAAYFHLLLIYYWEKSTQYMLFPKADIQTWIPDPSGTVIFQTQLRLFK